MAAKRCPSATFPATKPYSALLLRELITRRYALSEINQAIAAMRDGSLAGRCLIEM
jgi:Zn-dependent alcohol dehydrogenase